MNASEIKAALASGKTVCWQNPGYQVKGTDPNNLIIFCAATNHAIGLTRTDGTTLNGKEEDFFILYQLPAILGNCHVKVYSQRGEFKDDEFVGGGEFVGSLGCDKPQEEPDEYYEALERVCLAHACQGIDITSEPYIQGLIDACD